MRLRVELLLLFALISMAFGGVVAYAKSTARDLLYSQIRLGLTARGFPRLERDRQVMLESLGVEFEQNPGVVLYRDAFLTADGDLKLLREGPGQPSFEQVMTTLRSPQGPDGKPWALDKIDLDKLQARSRSVPEAWLKCRARLLTLWSDTMLGLMSGGQQGKEGLLDLLLVTDRSGQVLAEQRTKADGTPPEPSETIPAPALNEPARLMIGQALKGEAPEGNGIQYLVYGDHELYLASVHRFELGGVALLGSRVNDRFLAQAAEVAGEKIEARVVLSGETPRAIGPQDGVSEDLLRMAHPAGAPGSTPIVAARLGGKRFLVSQRPLGSSAWIYFLRDLKEIEDHLDSQTRTIATTGVVVFLVLVLLVFAVTSRVTRPIEALSDKMVKVGEGDLSQQASVWGSREVAQAALSFNQMVTGLRQKEEALKFLPQQAREEIAKAETGEVQLGGQRITGTILFSDLRGFTSLSERLAPQEVVALLNEYLNRMTETILQHGGDVNEFIGDAILAVFKGPDQAAQAVTAALAMDEELKKLQAVTTNQDLKGQNQGIGIHTGELVAGTIGTKERKKGAVVGDTVNLAARIQDRSRSGKHTCILVSEATAENLRKHKRKFQLELFGDEEFKGKSAPVRVWEVLSVED